MSESPSSLHILLPHTLQPGEVHSSTTAERLATRGPMAVAARHATMATMAAEQFDFAIIGGGITGAGVAREAALAGYRVALLERDDFASGTSSRSSRLVHGGVRYLEHGHIALVFESSRERQTLLRIAPHLVRPLSFTWPVYRGARVPLWKVRAGLTLYDALSLFRNQRHHGLSAAEVVNREPALSPNELHGGAQYWDAATDDARLTLANALAAREEGACVLNHVSVVGGARGGASKRLTGVMVTDQIAGATFTVNARVVINATGPWSDATAALTGEAYGTQILGSAGAHIAVPRQRLGNNDAVTLVSPVDGRVMFVLPAGAHAIIGTTERKARRGPDTVKATEPEVDYLLRSVNARFPSAQLTMDDVVAAWAGIRPLAVTHAGGQSANTKVNANAASREHAITHRDDGLMSITGGKLTTFRSMAADIVKHARVELARHHTTSNVPEPSARAHRSEQDSLPGGDIESLPRVVHDVRETVHDAAVAEHFAFAYGNRWRNVWSFAQRDQSLTRRLSDDLPYLLAEIPHAVEREMACTLSDILIRRTHVAFETRDHGRAIAKRIAPLMAVLLNWSDTEQSKHLANYDTDVERIFGIDMLDSPS